MTEAIQITAAVLAILDTTWRHLAAGVANIDQDKNILYTPEGLPVFMDYGALGRCGGRRPGIPGAGGLAFPASALRILFCTSFARLLGLSQTERVECSLN